jgi:uncharacterized protein
MTRTLFALVLVAFASLETRAAPRGPESVPDPRPHAFVVDETDVLRLADIDTMNKTARAFSTTGELVVLVLDSIGGASPRPFATAVFNRFRVDRHERNRGVLVMFAIEDRKAEIVLGDGWPATTTILTDRVMQDVVIAQMKAGDPRNAVIGAAQELATVLAGVVPSTAVSGDLNAVVTKEAAAPVSVETPAHRAKKPTVASKAFAVVAMLFAALMMLLFNPISLVVGVLLLVWFLSRKNGSNSGGSSSDHHPSSFDSSSSFSHDSGGGSDSGGSSSGSGSSGEW